MTLVFTQALRLYRENPGLSIYGCTVIQDC